MPSAANPYAAFWFGIFYTAFYLADTVTNVPYEALGPELSDIYEERSRIYFVHKFFNMLGERHSPDACTSFQLGAQPATCYIGLA